MRSLCGHGLRKRTESWFACDRQDPEDHVPRAPDWPFPVKLWTEARLWGVIGIGRRGGSRKYHLLQTSGPRTSVHLAKPGIAIEKLSCGQEFGDNAKGQ